MHLHSQSLEASFEPSDGRPQSASSPPADPVVQDFNAFFERLSSLDNLRWSTETNAETLGAAVSATKPAAQAAPRLAPTAAAKAAPQAAPEPIKARRPPVPPSMEPPPRAAAPKITVVQSERDLGPPPAPTKEAIVAAVRSDRLTVRDVARFLKLVFVGLLLFALGLGAGWAALSIPGRFENASTDLASLMERTRAIAVPRTGIARPAAADRLRLTESGTATANGAPNGTAAASTAATAAAAPGGTTLGSDENESRTSEPDTGFVMGGGTPVDPGSAASAPAATPTVRPAPAKPAAVALRPAPPTAVRPRTIEPTTARATPPAAPAPSAARTAGTTEAEAAFTLQVGACSSDTCVENYRRLLEGRVSADHVQVVTQTQGAATIQRIRVQPLTRGAAERLKAELAAGDAHFRDAYVTALH